jgi:hypothetical protein
VYSRISDLRLLVASLIQTPLNLRMRVNLHLYHTVSWKATQGAYARLGRLVVFWLLFCSRYMILVGCPVALPIIKLAGNPKKTSTNPCCQPRMSHFSMSS